MKRIILVVAAMLFSSFAFAGTVKLGALFAVTGPAGYLGMPEKQTLEMLVEEANAQGGINGDKIELVFYDTQGMENRTLNYFKRLVTKDKVSAIIGPTRTGSTLVIKDMAERYKVPLISCAASRKIVEPVSKYVYKTPQSDIQVAEKLYEYLVSKNKTKIAIITAQSGYGETGKQALIDIAEEYPVDIIIQEKFNDTDKDMTAQLAKIKEAKPDAVICWGVGPAPAIVARNAKQLGIDNLYMTQGVASKKFINLAGDAAEGIKLTAGRLMVAEQLEEGDKYKDVLIDYKNAYEKKFDDSVSVFGGHAYDAFHLFKIAYEKANGNMDKFLEELESIKGFIGIAGEFNMTPEDHTGLSKDAFVIVEIQNGDFVLVE
ncbi:ABC transporter substrate-binding protein [Limisalsivibrio acetivorans]|uniref:ABC transporter substrate-binding protein n=1 Tax=Limisalsivibrio acetivorans TaxID=1304888 RepID=UPI0003B3CCD0|nr:ABC transporter substrate-binding protein [Limisalsivibrio acetivorans]